MSFCPVSIFCPSGVAKSIASDAASAVFSALEKSMTTTAAWFIGQVVDLMNSSTTPQLDSTWFTIQLEYVAKVGGLVVLPILIIATIGPVIRQDLKQLGRIWGVGLPIAIFAGIVVPFFTAQFVAVTDDLCRALTAQNTDISEAFANAIVKAGMSGYPQFAGIAIAAVAVVGALLVWIELVLRSAAVYLATFFMPLILVGYIWPATARMTRKAVEILVSLVVSKFVIVGAILLGISALHGSANPFLSGAAILLLAAFAPFTLFKLAPIVEMQAIGHLEGMARRPFHAAGRAATAAVNPSHPVTGQLMNLVRGRTRSEPTSVGAQFIPLSAADFPIGAQRGGGDDG